MTASVPDPARTPTAPAARDPLLPFVHALVAIGALAACLRVPPLESEMHALTRALSGEAFSDNWTAVVHAPLHPLLQAFSGAIDGRFGPFESLVPYRLWNVPFVVAGSLSLARLVTALGAPSAAAAACVLAFLGPFLLTQGGTSANYVIEASMVVVSLDRLLALVVHPGHRGVAAALAVGLAASLGYMTVPVLGPAVAAALLVLVRRRRLRTAGVFVTALTLVTMPLWSRLATGVAMVLSASRVLGESSLASGHVPFPERPEHTAWSDFAFVVRHQLGLPGAWFVAAAGLAAGIRRPLAWWPLATALLVSVAGAWVYFVPHNLVVIAPLVATALVLGVFRFLPEGPMVARGGAVASCLLVAGAWLTVQPDFMERYEPGVGGRVGLARLATRVPPRATVVLVGGGLNPTPALRAWCLPRAPVRECLGVPFGPPPSDAVHFEERRLAGDRFVLGVRGDASARKEAVRAFLERTAPEGYWVLVEAGSRRPEDEGLDGLVLGHCRAFGTEAGWMLHHCPSSPP